MMIDGVEVPVIGAQCTFGEGTMASAQIQVIATDEVYDIPPRAFVALFVYDASDYIFDPVTGNTDVPLDSSDARRWVLFFAGEMTAVAMQKRSNGRSATLTCACPTNYWDSLKQQYINFSNAGVELFEAAFMGVKQDRLKFFDVTTQGTDSKLYTWLTQSKGPSGEASLSLGVQRIIREMFFSVNDFYGEAFNRLRLGDQVVGIPDDQTAAKLFKLQFAEKFIKNRVGGGGGQVSARHLINTLLGPVFHTYVTVPFPKFDRKGEALGGVRLDPTAPSDKALSDSIISRKGSWENSSLNYTIIKPDTWFLVPPSCNVVFPSQYNSLAYSRNYLAEPTRMFLRTSLIFTGKSEWMTERFYAPDFSVFNDLLYKEGGYLERMSTTLMDHETFVGITPVEVWQEDLAAYVQKGPRRQYLSMLTDYLFWKYRFGTRQVSVSGPLNMNLVPGYPGVVLDRVSSATGRPKHYVGTIATILHSVDQNGGMTNFTMVGARTHDEEVDFDGKGRSLEEITTRGTDGFLDDRYDPNRIGKEVYQILFGCDSIVDAQKHMAGRSAVGRTVAGTSKNPAPIRDAVDAIAEMYQLVADSDADTQTFIANLTSRPKANFVEMLGESAHMRENINQPGYSSAAASNLRRSDPAAASAEGFFASATDPESSVVKNASYKSAKNGTTGKYLLDVHLKARQAKVRSYVESLRFQGMRG